MLRVVQLGALARSGETLLLRALAAHPQVHVVHDLHAVNHPADQALYHFLRVWPAPTVPRWQLDRHLAPGRVPASAQVLLLKQGVFSPRHNVAGFGLLRNPYAVFASLWSYDALLADQVPTMALNHSYWQCLRLPRLLIWAEAMQPGLAQAIHAKTDPVRQFLVFWRARAQQLQRRFSTLVHYERFVRDPQTELHRICAALGLPFETAMLRSHEAYAPGERGHGGIELSAPIRPASAWKATSLVDLAPFIAEVDEGPVDLYRGLYSVAPAGFAPARGQQRLLVSLSTAYQFRRSKFPSKGSSSAFG